LRIIFSVEHPAWAHQFRYVIQELEKKGHTFKVVAINKDRDLELLDAFNIPYEIISATSGKNVVEKGFIFFMTTLKIFFISLKFKPDIFIGRASPMMAINSFLFRKPHIVFEDTEHSDFCLFLCKLLSDVIITPKSFLKDLGNKQIKINSYKELFYLHPNHFKPAKSILSKINLRTDENFFIIRFVAWDAHHDIGQSGIKNKDIIIEALEKYGRILITSEVKLPQNLKKYQIKLPFEKIHDLMNYATLYFGEGSTTAAEAAMLGIPSIYISSFAGKIGNLIDLEKNYDLLYSFNDQNKGLQKAIDLINRPNITQEWSDKRDFFLKDKIDPTTFMVWFIERYPDSVEIIKESPGFERKFQAGGYYEDNIFTL
jgi:hypothetical protein